MKMLSFNVRGVASRVKWRRIREIVVEEQVDMILIQETKLQEVSTRLCYALWGDGNFDWKAKPAINRAGGLLCIWRKDTFKLHDCLMGNGFIGLLGSWGEHEVDCVIVNVYSSCILEEKRTLWAQLVEWKRRSAVLAWCVAGDFNAIRPVDERRGVAEMSNHILNEIAEFNSFIDNLEVMDIPIHGRKYTWFKPNGQSMSRLDRFLVSQGWASTWPHCFQVVLDRDISDHCPLLLRLVAQNWGPKPFRVLNCWFQHHSFKKFVEDSWTKLQVQGRGIFIFKEKLKMLKADLKKWNVKVFGDVNASRRGLVKRLGELDALA
ncbi:uncharacterized protein LOC130744910 [Lotus japonicus]|uniref:uncharacterized protein LOC130744910 n=1 Tax=Lotus japonicus TaxID=34305 RepID=UPI002586F370|nr:uncharacterized protein LOC130744910 [Lotus japonicus]